MTGATYSLDANVLVYTVDRGDWRHPLALQMVRLAARGGCVLTMQALGEFFVASTRKKLLSRDEVAAQVRRWLAAFPLPLATRPELVEVALAASEAGRFGYWDAMLVATAAAAGCTAVISEDMAAGATLAGARIVPAFAGGAITPEALALLDP